MRGSVRGMLASAGAALGLFVMLGSTNPASAALAHGGGFHFHGGGLHAFRGGFHGFHGGFARFGGAHFHALMAGRHWNYYHSNGRFGTGWGRHGGFVTSRFMPVPHGFASGLGRNGSGRRFAGARAVSAGYGGYGGWGGYYARL